MMNIPCVDSKRQEQEDKKALEISLVGENEGEGTWEKNLRR